MRSIGLIYRRSAAAGVRALIALACFASPLRAQTPAASIVGTASTQESTVLLPGTQVFLIDAATGDTVAQTSADDRGAFMFVNVKPGAYRIRGMLAEFDTTTAPRPPAPPLQIRAGQQLRVALDLPIKPVAEQVTVHATESSDLMTTTALPAQSVRVEDIRRFEPVSSGDIQSVLALMPGALHGPGGGPITINGGRPTQTRVEIDGMSIVDPVTGRADLDLPSDAIDGVQIQPNPSGGAFGRLSAGVVQFQTRQAPQRFSYSLSTFVPEPLFRQNEVHGIRDFEPRLFAGGPLFNGKLMVAESLTYEYWVPRVHGEEETPANETPRTRVNSFTRIDAPLSPKHLLTLTFNAAPRNIDHLGSGVFLDTSASPSQHEHPYLGTLSERATFGPNASLESAVSFRDITMDIDGTAAGPLVISPAGRTGNYYNTQHRDEQTAQWKETLTATGKNWTGEHLVKLGSDVLFGTYSGTDVSRPVELRRLDGTLAERIEFAQGSAQHASATDAALFAEDTWTPTPRLKFEPSIRLEHDGLNGQTHLAPRLAATFGLTPNGLAVVHAGAGRFYERTPLVARSFPSFEPFTDTRFSADGSQPVGTPATSTMSVAPQLNSPSSFIWNVGYDHRFSAAWQFSAKVLERKGSNELIVQPTDQGAQRQILLDSTGKSTYREVSLWGEFRRGVVRATASYVWSMARGDLNSLDAFFGTFRNPIIQPNEYGPTSLDVPHRVIAWSSVPGPWGLTFSNVVEFRTGFPYSAVDDNQQFVGKENSRRFPNIVTANVNVFHDVKLGSHVVRLIVRAYNLLNTFNPLEVQSYATAPDFGNFYSTVERRFALDFDLLR